MKCFENKQKLDHAKGHKKSSCNSWLHEILQNGGPRVRMRELPQIVTADVVGIGARHSR
jgi:hypothetical protein